MSLGRVPIPGSSITISGWKLTAERPVGRRHRIATILALRTPDEGQPLTSSEGETTEL